ncbi:MAG: 30S ribosome-binding factor RbfA [Acidimicrobiia bacterium]|nr:30S ribosome-binding factor RbfA [Acidimicrobiia bacterium]
MSKPPSPRMRKVNELLREILAEEVTELKDPRIGFLTITGVDTAPNLRNATVFFSVLGDEDAMRDTGEALTHAHSRLQRAIARQSRLKYTPVLEFQPDMAIEQGLRINEILRHLHDDEDVVDEETSE